MTYPDSASAKDYSVWAAFQRLAVEQQDLAYTLAYYLLGDEQHAATALRSAFRRAYHDFGSFRRGSFRSWLAQQVLATCRERGFRKVLSLANHQSGISSRLAALPVDCRVVVILVDLLGMDYEEAAQATGYSPKAVSHRLARARKIITYGG
jgi:DNA-directed RNA polymerase specialized sigma24 family protein